MTSDVELTGMHGDPHDPEIGPEEKGHRIANANHDIGARHLAALSPACSTHAHPEAGTKWLYGKIKGLSDVSSSEECCQSCDAYAEPQEEATCYQWSWNHQNLDCELFGDDGFPETRPPFSEWVTGKSSLRTAPSKSGRRLATGDL
jgi:hypothetical protein